MCVEVPIEGLHVLCHAAVSVFKLGALLTAPSDGSIWRPNSRERKRVMYQYVPVCTIMYQYVPLCTSMYHVLGYLQ